MIIRVFYPIDPRVSLSETGCPWQFAKYVKKQLVVTLTLKYTRKCLNLLYINL